MTYNEFTLDAIIPQFGLDLREDTGHFARRPVAPISDLLQQTLEENVPLAFAIGTEKARSELIIMPVLLEARRQSHGDVSLFSGLRRRVQRGHRAGPARRL